MQTWGDVLRLAEKQGACCPECWAAGYLAAPTRRLGAFIKAFIKGALLAAATMTLVWWG